jgi:integrase
MKGNRWWFKRDIPAAIRGLIARGTAYQVNLQTGDIKAAMTRRDELARESDKLFADARAGRLVGSVQDTIRDRAEAWAAEMAASARDPIAWTARATGRDRDDVEPEDAFTPHELVEAEGDSIRQKHGKEAARRFRQIVSGRVPINHYLEAYLTEARLAPKTTNEKRNLIRRFNAWAEGEGVTLTEITQAVAGRYVTANIAPLDRSTAKKHLGAVKRYWEWMGGRGYVSKENPWAGQLPADKARGVRRDEKPDERAFTTEEIKTLIYSPFPPRMRPQFEAQLRDLMRIGALSGMRLAEIATLRASECVFPEDHEALSYFNVTHGKTKAAVRRVPIHSGLSDIIKARLKDKGPDEWLFHELARENNAGDVVGKRFASYRKVVGVDDKRDGKRRSLVNFHSFRRWFITEAERAGQMGHIISAVAGHEDGRKSMAFGVYSDGPSDAQLKECIEAVTIPAI